MKKHPRKKNYSNEYLDFLHGKSTNNRESLGKSSECGCFSCFRIFNPKKIKEWTDEKATALCHCGADSIVASNDIDIDKKLLKEMNKRFL
jgi:hypothetical protein